MVATAHEHGNCAAIAAAAAAAVTIPIANGGDNNGSCQAWSE